MQVITWDRAKAYAKGAQQGAAAALQVTDRFPLLQNLAEALIQAFTAQGECLDAVNTTLRQQLVPLPTGENALPMVFPIPPRSLRRVRLSARYAASSYMSRSGRYTVKAGHTLRSPNTLGSVSGPSGVTS